MHSEATKKMGDSNRGATRHKKKKVKIVEFWERQLEIVIVTKSPFSNISWPYFLASSEPVYLAATHSAGLLQDETTSNIYMSGDQAQEDNEDDDTNGEEN